MKKLIAPVLAAVLLLLSACTPAAGTDNRDIDLAALADKLLDSGSFGEELPRVDDEIAVKTYCIDNASAVYFYAASGAVADELALFEFEAEKDAQSAVELAQARITAQREGFADYIPAEVLKLDNAVVRTYGRYLVVCVSESEQAGEIIAEYFEQKG